MKDNKEILNEAFFNKAKGIDKVIKNLPVYAPISKNSNAFQVTDTDEVKKRLSGAFGVTFGNNNVKSMASRAIKSFPIVISENVDPETAVILKRLMEEQYADYINLLVSNQVVDLADYKSSEDGNIAIQALDKLSGTDFSSTRIADKAATGKLGRDDVFNNIPLYSLLKEEKRELKTGNPIFDALLEDAIVIPEEYTNNIREFIEYYADDIEELNEATSIVAGGPSAILPDSSAFSAIKSRGITDDNNVTTFDHYLMDLDDKDEKTADRVIDRDTVSAFKRGLLGTDRDGNELYNKLTTADVIIDPHLMDAAINKSVGDILNDPRNVEIRDRFEKATFLLQSRRISGMEYYQYLTLRLGIPVSDKAREILATKFRIDQIVDYSNYDDGYHLTAKDRENIARNKMLTHKVVKIIKYTKLRRFITGMVATAGGAGIAAAGYAGLAAIPLLAWSMTPVGWFALGGALVGATATGIAHIIQRIKRKRAEKLNALRDKAATIEGWERVEALINQIYNTQDKFRTSLDNKADDPIKISRGDVVNKPISSEPINIDDNRKDLERYLRDVNRLVLKESFDDFDSTTEDDTFDFSAYLNEDLQKEINGMLFEATEEFEKEDAVLYNELLTESVFSKVFGKKKLGGGTMPVEVKYIEKDANKDAIVVPQFMAGQRFAYGSTEFERKDVKDRKYNQPLIMTVKFKERFSDGKVSDNELTAVIGILGKIIRVPSEEMEYILTENLKDNTIEGFLKDPNGSLNNMISDMIGAEKITREAKKLPQSADLWRNLEKVATLAAANKISGHKTNNIANAHIVFSQNEIDSVRNETGIDYLKSSKYGVKLMQRYSAFTLMVANDAGMRVYILDGKDNTSWDVVPYSALMGRDGSDQLSSALTKLARL